MQPDRAGTGRGGLLSSRPKKKACVDCHARKVKCDWAADGAPCSNCRSANVKCVVAAPKKRRRAPARTRSKQTSGRATSECSLPPAPASEEAPAPGQGGPEDDAGFMSAAVSPVDRADDYELAERHLVDFFGQNLQDKPIKTRLTYVGNELSNLNYLTRQRPVNQSVHHYPCSDTYVSTIHKHALALTAPPNIIPKDALILPPKHISDVLITAYFDHVHPYFPIIDRDSFLDSYHGTGTSPPIILLQAVCLAGSHAAEAFRNNQDLKAAFFRRAKVLFDRRYETDRMYMVQAALLLTWFSDGGDDVCANAWWWIGCAARVAFGLGMHREVKPSKMPENDKRAWRRTWWCLVQFDCMISLCYGRPRSINLDDCDVSPLEPGDFDSSTSCAQRSFAIHHAKLCVIVSELVSSNFSVKATKAGISKRTALAAADAALAGWELELPDELCEHSTRADDQSQPGSLLLFLTYHTVLVQLHRLGSGEDPGDPGDDQICEQSASRIIQIFGELAQRSALRQCWFYAPSSLFTAMLQVSKQLQSKNPILAMRARDMYKRGLQSLRRLIRHWLSAASIWRLFESGSPTFAQRISGRPMPDTSGENQVHLTGGFPSPSTASSAAALSSPAMLMNAGQGQLQDMDWVEPFSGEQLGDNSVHLEPGRWGQDLDDYQSLYWSDPLSSIRLLERAGNF